MTEIVAIVRRHRAAATKYELERIGCDGYTAYSVLGRGWQRGVRQAGIRRRPAGQRKTEARVGWLGFLPKVMFSIVVEDEAVEPTVDAIMKVNRTGEVGDGRIFVMPTAHAYRVSEREPEAAGAGGWIA